MLLSRSVYSFAELSLSPVFRRQWPSLYEALSDCRPKRHKLRKLYIKQVPKNERVILGGDPGQTHLIFLDKLLLMCIGLKEGDRKWIQSISQLTDGEIVSQIVTPHYQTKPYSLISGRDSSVVIR